LAAHGGERGFGHGNGAEKICVELAAQFFELDIFGESGDGKSGVVDEDVDTSVVVDDRVNECGQRVEVRDVEGADVEQRGDTCCACGLVEAVAAGKVAREVSNPKPLEEPVMTAIFSAMGVVR
jgi:hypothetical protein